MTHQNYVAQTQGSLAVLPAYDMLKSRNPCISPPSNACKAVPDINGETAALENMLKRFVRFQEHGFRRKGEGLDVSLAYLGFAAAPSPHIG